MDSALARRPALVSLSTDPAVHSGATVVTLMLTVELAACLDSELVASTALPLVLIEPVTFDNSSYGYEARHNRNTAEKQTIFVHRFPPFFPFTLAGGGHTDDCPLI